jgi:hypothetical protein
MDCTKSSLREAGMGTWQAVSPNALFKTTAASGTPAISQIRVMAGEKHQSDLSVKKYFAIQRPCERREQQAVVDILPPSARIPAGGRVGVARAQSAGQFDTCGSGINPTCVSSKQQKSEI